LQSDGNFNELARFGLLHYDDESSNDMNKHQLTYDFDLAVIPLAMRVPKPRWRCLPGYAHRPVTMNADAVAQMSATPRLAGWPKGRLFGRLMRWAE